jgi:hypothetical protein
MKKQLFFIAIAGLFSTMASAADLYVRDLGAGGAYSTISAAITAAADGDRIIIKPKIGNAPYLENLNISKSLTFLSETNFAKYYVQGTISITPAVNMVVTINNMYAYQSSISTFATTLTGGRATINLINCTATGNFDLDNTQRVTANVFQSTCAGMYFVHGKVTGCTIDFLQLTDDAAPAATTDVSIIGNDLSSGASLTAYDYAFNVSNNNIAYQASIAASTSTAIQLTGLSIDHMKVGSTNFVLNNRIYNETSGVGQTNKYAALYCSAIESSVLNVYNNIITNLSSNTGQNYAISNYNGVPTVIAVNNLCAATYVSWAVDSEVGTISNGVYSLDLGSFSSTGQIINAGIDEAEYQDIDLTTNDIGPFGGSNSWNNFWNPNAVNRPRVTYLNTPRRIYNGTTTMPVEATGISK